MKTGDTPMIHVSEEAEDLNKTISTSHPFITQLLSEKGKAIFFPRMGTLKQGAEAKDKRINATLGIATEDDNSPMRLRALSDLIPLNPKGIFPYAPSSGVPELRQAWKDLLYKKNPSLNNSISLPVVTNGLSHALSILGYLFVEQGDEIILTDIHWENYHLIFQLGWRAVFRPFNTFDHDRFDLNSFEKEVFKGSGKKILLLNFPNNPTGYTLTNEEAYQTIDIIKRIADRGNPLVVIMDDAYFGLVYEKGVYKESLFSKLANLHENVLAVKVDGATKEDYAWGFRVGFITYGSKDIDERTCKALEDKTAGAIRGNISSASHLSQRLLLNTILSDQYQEEKERKYHLLKSRYNRVCDILTKNKQKFSEYFSHLPFNSGYFMCIKLKDNLDAEAVRQRLLSTYSTGLITVDNLLRIAYSSVPENDIPLMFDNIYNACRDVSK